MTRLGIPWRDLRILDPSIPSPSPAAIFIREQAIVFNVESLRMIITKDEVSLSMIMPSPSTCNDPTGCGMAWHGMAWHGMAGRLFLACSKMQQ